MALDFLFILLLALISSTSSSTTSSNTAGFSLIFSGHHFVFVFFS